VTGDDICPQGAPAPSRDFGGGDGGFRRGGGGGGGRRDDYNSGYSNY